MTEENFVMMPKRLQVLPSESLASLKSMGLHLLWAG
jgi:hypothetical protein